MDKNELKKYLNDYLNCDEYDDLGPNGLQVEGKPEINKIITAVSASVELFEKAIAEKADAIIVHHGIIWNFERPLYKGGYRERVRLLLEHDLNLYAFHLPLDAHPEIGNNYQICQKLNLTNIEPFGEYRGKFVGMRGEANQIPKETFFKNVKTLVNRELIVFPYGPEKVENVGVISGGAQKEIKQAVLDGLDVYITGEVSEHIMHFAKEEKIHFISAGHYATEKFGIFALGEHLKKKLNLAVNFVDIPNPV